MPCSCRQHADRSPAVQEIGHHLHGDFARVGTDAAIGHAMVRGEHDTHRLNDADTEGALNRAHLRGERFEPAQGALGLRQPVQAAVGVGANGLVD